MVTDNSQEYTENELEIIEALNLNNEELEELEKEGHYKSIEFYLIIFYSNAGLYYLSDEETERLEEMADSIEDTPKGRVFAFS